MNTENPQNLAGAIAPIDSATRLPRTTEEDRHQEHFKTDHLLPNLRQRTISSGLVTAAAQGAQFFLNLGYIMVLARILVPQEFGLVAMVTTVTGFLHIFQDAGLSTATVQRHDITHAQVSNLFWVNVVVGGVTTLLVAASAPAVAWFYREPRLVGITLVLSITFVLASSAVQHIALLNRQMRFKVIAVIDILSMLAGYLTGIGMALSKYGYWALVGASVTQVAIKLVLTWSISRWWPRSPSRNTQTWHLLRFGANITAGSLMYEFARGADSLLIGRFFGAAAVGQPGTREGLGRYEFDRIECLRLFFPCRTAVRSRRCSDILFGFVCPNTVASCLLHCRAAGSGEQERSLDRMPAASACLGSSLRHSLVRTHFRSER